MDADGEEIGRRCERYGEAILYFIDHPEAIDNEFMKSFINSVKADVEALEAEQQAKEEAAKAATPLSRTYGKVMDGILVEA